MAPRNAGESAEVLTVEGLSARLRGTLTSLRRPVASAVDAFQKGREKVKDIAPKVIGLFNAIKVDHPAFSFVEFTRMFDATVPTHGADRDAAVGYRNHPTYYTLDYMRRLQNQKPRGRQGVRETATDALARAIATVLAVIGGDPNREAVVWTAIQTEMGFNERIVSRLRKRVAQTEPFFKIEVPAATQARIKVGNVIHMERAEAPEAGGAMAQPGQRVGVGRRRSAAA